MPNIFVKANIATVELNLGHHHPRIPWAPDENRLDNSYSTAPENPEIVNNADRIGLHPPRPDNWRTPQHHGSRLILLVFYSDKLRFVIAGEVCQRCSRAGKKAPVQGDKYPAILRSCGSKNFLRIRHIQARRFLEEDCPRKSEASLAHGSHSSLRDSDRHKLCLCFFVQLGYRIVYSCNTLFYR